MVTNIADTHLDIVEVLLHANNCLPDVDNLFFIFIRNIAAHTMAMFVLETWDARQQGL
jgi:hypothetical protein